MGDSDVERKKARAPRRARGKQREVKGPREEGEACKYVLCSRPWST